MTDQRSRGGSPRALGGPPLPRHRRALGLVVAVLAVLLGLTSCSSQFATEEKKPSGPQPTAIATAKGSDIAVYGDPGAKRPELRLSNPTPLDQPRVFLVEGQKGDWLRVLLPIRPNGSKGWVRADDVTLSKTFFGVDIYLSEHQIVVHKGKEIFLEEPIGVGKKNTPTPSGEYYLVALFSPPNPKGEYGPYAFGLSGYSDALHVFKNGPGRLGLHGTNHPELIGHDVSHGCIRMRNEAITKLAKALPLGTPVHIHA